MYGMVYAVNFYKARRQTIVRMDLKQLQKKGITLVIPSPPQIITRLLAMISEDRCSAEELSELILKDPSLTARILMSS